MKNKKIAEVLKAYRKMNNLSVRDVTELLEEKSLKVAEKTVYGWESSATQPDADTLLLLCDIYNIDNILGTFGYTDEEPINLTKHEHHLIEQYRKHPQQGKGHFGRNHQRQNSQRQCKTGCSR